MVSASLNSASSLYTNIPFANQSQSSISKQTSNAVITLSPSKVSLCLSRSHHALNLNNNNVSISSPTLKISAVHRSSRAAQVTKDSWDRLILASEVPVLVEFFASWCGPCRMVHRIIDEIAVEYAGKLNCFVVDTDHDLEIAEDYDIKAVPVVLLFKNGAKCKSIAGTMPKEFYLAAIDRVLCL